MSGWDELGVRGIDTAHREDGTKLTKPSQAARRSKRRRQNKAARVARRHNRR